MSEERFIKIENHLENHDKDIHSIAGSLSDISQQMRRTNDILQSMAIKDERITAKIDMIESKVMARLDRSDESLLLAHKRITANDNDKKWIVKIIIGFIVIGALTAYIKFAGQIS